MPRVNGRVCTLRCGSMLRVKGREGYLEVWHYAQGEGKGGQVIARDIQTFQQLEFGYFVR